MVWRNIGITILILIGLVVIFMGYMENGYTNCLQRADVEYGPRLRQVDQSFSLDLDFSSNSQGGTLRDTNEFGRNAAVQKCKEAWSQVEQN